MGLGSLFNRLFGGSGGDRAKAPDRSVTVEYKGFRVIPAPKKHGGQFLTCALIEKDFADGIKSHELIRADTHGSEDDAKSFALTKAKQVIDEQGERIFR